MKAFKAFIKPFETPQRSAKIKVYVNIIIFIVIEKFPAWPLFEIV